MRNIQVIQGLPFKVKEIIDITDTLPSRPNDPETPRTPDQITHISIHHSAVENGSIQGYANTHVNIRKWYHIGYHLVVKADQLYQTNNLLTFSYHTSSHNYYTIGIGVSADLSKREMSEVERATLYAAILTIMYMFDISVDHVLGHNEFPGNEKTLCPCMVMNKVRFDIRTLKTKIDYARSEDGAQQLAFHVSNQILYFSNFARGINPDGTDCTPGNKEWGKNVLLELEPFMRARDLL